MKSIKSILFLIGTIILILCILYMSIGSVVILGVLIKYGFNQALKAVAIWLLCLIYCWGFSIITIYKS